MICRDGGGGRGRIKRCFFLDINLIIWTNFVIDNVICLLGL